MFKKLAAIIALATSSMFAQTPTGNQFNVQSNQGGSLYGDDNFKYRPAKNGVAPLVTITGDLTVTGTCTGCGGGGGTPASPSTSVQFNNGGIFGGSANLTYSGNQLRVGPTGTMFVGPDESSLDSHIVYSFAGGQTQLITMVGGASDTPWIASLIEAQQLNDDNDVVGQYIPVILKQSGASTHGTVQGYATDVFLDVPAAVSQVQVGFEAALFSIGQGFGNYSAFFSKMNQDGAGTLGTLIDFDASTTAITTGAVDTLIGLNVSDKTGATNNYAIKTGAGDIQFGALTTTGAATGKKVVCVDTATGKLYASTSGVACAN